MFFILIIKLLFGTHFLNFFYFELLGVWFPHPVLSHEETVSTTGLPTPDLHPFLCGFRYGYAVYRPERYASTACTKAVTARATPALLWYCIRTLIRRNPDRSWNAMSAMLAIPRISIKETPAIVITVLPGTVILPRSFSSPRPCRRADYNFLRP